VGDGEEALLTPGGAAVAEVRSRGFLPLRARSTGSYRLRPPFPGTAVVIGTRTFEVLSEIQAPSGGAVVYRLRDWPEGEAIRDRVVYGAALVQAAREERERARQRAKARPFRWLLYPAVGLLPEEVQTRLCDRLGLYSVTATLVSGLGEGLGALILLGLSARREGGAGFLALAWMGPVLFLFVLPGLGRAFSAALLRETGGSAVVVALHQVLRTAPIRRERHDPSFVPLTRSAFWDRLERPDRVVPDSDGLVYRSLLPHLTWKGRRLRADSGYWSVTTLLPELDRGRLVFSYRLTYLGDPPPPGEPPPTPPAATAYADEVLGEVEREWDQLNEGFSWLTCLLEARVQERAFSHRGGPGAARRAIGVTAVAEAGLGIYLLSFLPGPPGDPLAPLVALLAAGLVVEGLLRLRKARSGEFAPSLLRAVLPSDSLRPERIAFHAHRDAEREALGVLSPRT
jgi:hypothetical protein